jgi:hypothetical protein
MLNSARPASERRKPRTETFRRLLSGLAVAATLLLAACPEVTVEPGSGPQGARQMELDVYTTYMELDGQTQVTFTYGGQPSSIVVEDTTVLATGSAVAETPRGHLRLSVTIPAGGALGDHALTVVSGDRSAETVFTVTEQPLVQLVPASVEQAESSQIVQVVGTRTTFDTAFSFTVNVPGVTATRVPDPTDDDTHRTLSVDVPLSTLPQVYPGAVVIRSDHQSFALDLEVTPVTGRAIALSPDRGEQGERVTVSVTGNKMDFTLPGLAVTVTPDDQVDVESFIPLSPSQMEVTLGIHSNAATGPRQLAVTDPYGTVAAELEITEDPTPPQVTLVRNYGAPGESLVVQAQGAHTSFSSSDTFAVVEPPSAGVQASVIRVDDAEHADLQVDIAPGTEPGSFQITLVTDLEHAPASFDVVPAPQISLDPSSWYQREAVTVTVTGTDTHFATGDTDVYIDPASGVTVDSVQVLSESELALELYVDEHAPTSPAVPVVVTDSWDLTAQADFHVLPGRPAVELSPGGLPQGTEGATVTATGYFFTWSTSGGGGGGGGTDPTLDLDIQVEPACQPYLQVYGWEFAPGQTPPNANRIVFQVDVALLAPLGPCQLTFTDPSTQQVFDQVGLKILPGYEDILLGSITPGHLDGPTGPEVYAVDLVAGDVIRARVLRDPFSYIDPVLSLHSPGGSSGGGSGPNPQPVMPELLAENDDESAATVNPRIVYRAQTSGQYFLQVRDRLGFNVGDFELHVHRFEPEQCLELEPEPPLSQPPLPSTRNDTIASAELLADRLARGTMVDSADIDIYDPSALPILSGSLPPTEELLVQVIAQDVSPYATSGADTRLTIYSPAATHPPDPQSLVDATPISAWSPDPALYVARSDLGYIAVENEGPDNTAYWLNVRPAVVINEVYHDEATGWMASFVELQGKQGFDLGTGASAGAGSGAGAGACRLVAWGATASSGPLPDPLFDVDLTGRVIGPNGYHVIAHDDLVPGVPAGEAVPELSIVEDPANPYTTIAIELQCGGAPLDAVCYRGSALPECEGQAAVDTGPSGQSIGRGYLIDTDRNSEDFIPQNEPSPWARNYSEVW